jgi:hypothetical protein
MSAAADQHPESLPNSDSPDNFQSTAPRSGDREQRHHRRNAAEIAGETVEVVGKVPVDFRALNRTMTVAKAPAAQRSWWAPGF